MKTGIIRGIWGDVRMKRRSSHPPDPFCKLLKTVKEFKDRQDVVDVFYCFGLQNKIWLDYLGFEDVRLLHPNGWATPIIDPKFHDRYDGVRIHGYSYWWHKFKIVEEALKDFDSILWIDIDVEQLKPLPDDFFDELNSGADFRASLYVQSNWSWGAQWRYRHWRRAKEIKRVQGDRHRAAQLVPGCGYLYCRSKEVIREALEIQDEFPIWLDHQVMSLVLDRRYGEWIGQEAYVEKGYHTKGYYYGRQIYRPTLDETIFQAGKRYEQIP